MLFDGNLPLLEHLRFQLDLCVVEKREYTGSGFFTILNVPDSFKRTSGVNFKFGDVIGEIPGLIHSAGFLLFVEDGVLDMLEGYSYEEPWPEFIYDYALKYANENGRDWGELNNHIHT